MVVKTFTSPISDQVGFQKPYFCEVLSQAIFLTNSVVGGCIVFMTKLVMTKLVVGSQYSMTKTLVKFKRSSRNLPAPVLVRRPDFSHLNSIITDMHTYLCPCHCLGTCPGQSASLV